VREDNDFIKNSCRWGGIGVNFHIQADNNPGIFNCFPVQKWFFLALGGFFLRKMTLRRVYDH
jgi:hypothetical protein